MKVFLVTDVKIFITFAPGIGVGVGAPSGGGPSIGVGAPVGDRGIGLGAQGTRFPVKGLKVIILNFFA